MLVQVVVCEVYEEVGIMVDGDLFLFFVYLNDVGIFGCDYVGLFYFKEWFKGDWFFVLSGEIFEVRFFLFDVLLGEMSLVMCLCLNEFWEC